jgi:hypothetical protein
MLRPCPGGMRGVGPGWVGVGRGVRRRGVGMEAGWHGVEAREQVGNSIN